MEDTKKSKFGKTGKGKVVQPQAVKDAAKEIKAKPTMKKGGSVKSKKK